MTPGFRKLALTAHVTFSVAWLGAVAGFLALSIAGVTSRNPDAVRGAYVAMDLIGLFVIIPLSFAALATGLVEALGTHWGLFRHYWVIAKFLLTVLATGLLLLHQYTVVTVAARRVLGTTAGILPSAGRLGIQLVVDASLAILVLLTATTLAVYKPQGVTSFARRKQQARTTLPRQPAIGATREGPSLGLAIFLAVIAAIVVVFVVVHLTGVAGGPEGHSH